MPSAALLSAHAFPVLPEETRRFLSSSWLETETSMGLKGPCFSLYLRVPADPAAIALLPFIKHFRKFSVHEETNGPEKYLLKFLVETVSENQVPPLWSNLESREILAYARYKTFLLFHAPLWKIHAWGIVRKLHEKIVPWMERATKRSFSEVWDPIPPDPLLFSTYEWDPRHTKHVYKPKMRSIDVCNAMAGLHDGNAVSGQDGVAKTADMVFMIKNSQCILVHKCYSRPADSVSGGKFCGLEWRNTKTDHSSQYTPFWGDEKQAFTTFFEEMRKIG